MGFIVATGIECSAPIIAGGLRRDQLRLTGHDERFAEDFGLVAGMGISHLRYGVPFHIVARDPDALDWTWTDRAMAALRDHGIEPIVDLLHFGVPDHLTGFDDPRLPEIFLRYVAAFTERFPWVRWYTPVNEPYITALFSAHRGWWNERGTSDVAFVRALDATASCAIQAMEVIRAHRPDAVFLQSDGCEAFRALDAGDQRSVAAASFHQERSWLGFDLTFGRELDPRIGAWLEASGMDERRRDWFTEHGSSAGCIVGLDYYEMNEHLVDAEGLVTTAIDRGGFATIARDAYARYGLPFMLAETNNDSERAVAWLTETWNDSVAMLAEGLPVAGFCWYSLTDQIDWDTCMREANDRVNTFGLVDLDRRPRLIAPVYASLATAARDAPDAAPVRMAEPLAA